MSEAMKVPDVDRSGTNLKWANPNLEGANLTGADLNLTGGLNLT